MGLFVANAEANMGRILDNQALTERLLFDKPDALRRRDFGFEARRSFVGLIAFFKNMGQGACAGLLTLLGATHLTGVIGSSEAHQQLLASSIDPTTLQGLTSSMLISGLPGILEIIGAATLFLNAGRGTGRIIGLLAFVAIAVAHANGVSHTEFIDTLTQATNFASRFATGLAGAN
ncbi:MAG: hypothetical protein AAF720_01770 [Pseudomonadota bacterium]